MSFSEEFPTNHKNMARFGTPSLLPCSVGAMMFLNKLNQPNQQITKVQKLDPSLEHKPLQLNGNGFCTGQAHGLDFHQSIIKAESDSNESSHSDGRSNGVNFPSCFLDSHSLAGNQQNAGPMKMPNNSGCFGLNMLEGLNVPPPNDLTSLNNFHVNSLTSCLDGNNMIAANLMHPNMINAKMPEISGKRPSSGRKPTNSKEAELTPEEEQKRRQRRERNKEAAARCRKKRVEQTKSLEAETSRLQKQKEILSNQINLLKSESDKLFLILSEHNCKIIPRTS